MKSGTASKNSKANDWQGIPKEQRRLVRIVMAAAPNKITPAEAYATLSKYDAEAAAIERKREAVARRDRSKSARAAIPNALNKIGIVRDMLTRMEESGEDYFCAETNALIARAVLVEAHRELEQALVNERAASLTRR